MNCPSQQELLLEGILRTGNTKKKKNFYPDFEDYLSKQQKAQLITYHTEYPVEWDTERNTIQHWHVNAEAFGVFGVLKEALLWYRA